VPKRAASASAERSIAKSLREYARGIAGGLMFSLPLLYTMEMWWAGFTSQPERLLLYIAATFALLIGYNRYAGMRQDASWVEVAIDSVEEMGLGLVTAGLMLFLLGRMTSEMVLGVAAALGASAGRLLLQ
jgi:putative integral membrane protein (TIGR02587 family)